jgi:hypothetical protein
MLSDSILESYAGRIYYLLYRNDNRQRRVFLKPQSLSIHGG